MAKQEIDALPFFGREDQSPKQWLGISHEAHFKEA